MRRRNRAPYPEDWREIATRVKDAAGWRCIRCDHPHEPALGFALTVHHADIDPSNNVWWNLLALCQRCHLSVQGRVDLNRPWVLEHSDWFQVYVAGWYAHRYLGEELERSAVEARLPELLELERRSVLPWNYPQEVTR